MGVMSAAFLSITVFQACVFLPTVKMCHPDLHTTQTPLEHKFQLAVLHPLHFHPHPEQSLNILGPDGHSKLYRASPEGILVDEDGVPLPPFSLPSRLPDMQLKPILVNFAAPFDWGA
jgi:hypothetical protein